MRFAGLKSMCLATQRRTKFVRAETPLILLKDSEFGRLGDIITASAKFARQTLVPNRLAYYVPRVNGRPLLPKDWAPPVKKEDLVLEEITPAFVPVDTVSMDGALESSPSSSSASTPTRSAKFFEDTPLLVGVLQEFEQTPLTFFRVRSTPTADLVFGSVTTKDVARSLNEKLPDNCHLTFDPERITLLKSSESSVNQGEGKATEEELKKLTTLGESVARVIWAQGQPPRTIKVLIKVPERDFEKEKIEL